jgi:PAS domain S-box-containing protein
MSTNGNALSSPMFSALAEINFSSVMVTRASDEHGASQVVYVNPRFTELTGYTSEEVVGKTPGMLQGPDTDQAVLDRLEQDLANGRTFHGKTTNYRKSGEAFEMEWKVSKVIDLDDVHYYLAVQREAS